MRKLRPLAAAFLVYIAVATPVAAHDDSTLESFWHNLIDVVMSLVADGDDDVVNALPGTDPIG